MPWNLFDTQKVNSHIDKWVLCFDLTQRKKGHPRNVDDGRAAGDSGSSGRYGDGDYGLRMIPCAALKPLYNRIMSSPATAVGSMETAATD